MKRALALFLITCMLSTGTVYAAEGPDTYSGVTKSVGEYSQSEDNSDSGGAYESSGQEGSSGYETEDSGTYGDSQEGSSGYEAEGSGTYGDSQEGSSGYEAEGSGTYGDSGQEASSGYETEGSGTYEESGSEAATASDKAGYEAEAGYGEPAVNSGENSEAGYSEPATDSGKDDGAAASSESKAGDEQVDAEKSVETDTETSKPVSDSGKSEAVSDSGKSESASDSGNADGVNASAAEASARRGRAVSNSFDAVIESEKDDDLYVGSGEKDAENSTRTRIAIMSDIHYVTDQLISELGRDNLSNAALTEIRLMEEIDAILNAALEGASETNPDALLICGDLVSNGELLGAKALAAKLKAAKEKSGFANTGFYVVNGNHDINNSYAVDFTGDTEKAADRVQPSDFKEVFSGLGYGDDDHWAGGSHSVYVPTSDDPSAVTNHGGLSYSADIADGITLIVLDTGIYRTDENGESMYNNAQQTAGYVSDDLLAWAAGQAKEAKAKGNLVLAMSHHGLLPHYDVDLEDKAAFYMNSFRVPNWENVAETLADAGVSAVLTGHTHANDIATYVTKNNNVLYDVETAALCAYPCLWREFDIVTTGEGEEKSYTISIDTTYINNLSEADTSSWSFTIGGKTKTFEGDYNGNLQDYAYEKSGINEESLDDIAMYMAKSYLSDIVTSEGGFAGFLKKQLEIPEDKSLGEYMAESIRNSLGGFTGFSQEINNFLFKGSVTIENATAEGDVNPTFNVTADLSGIKEHGKMTLDMGYLPTAADELTAKVQEKLLEGDWLTNPYASNPLLDDLKKLVQNGVIPAFSQPLKEDDQDSTAVKMFNDAWQSFSLGDEGLADDARKAKWEEERELLGDDVLAGKITQGIWNEATKMNTSEYPAISELLSQRIVPEGKAGIISIETENPTDYLLPAITNLLGIDRLDTLSAIVRTASSLNMLGLGNPIPSSVVKPLTDKVVDLHEVMTTDNNIKHDNTWDFQMVRFDANGGSVSKTHALTVEDHKLADLPTPEERENYVFDGWFTEEEGGTKVTAEDDMTGISTLYAHWTYTGKDERQEQEEEPEPVKPEEDDSEDEPAKEEESESPVTPSATEEVQRGNGRSYRGRQAAEWGLHRYFVSRKALHDKIFNVEYSDNDHIKFCKAVLKAFEEGETIFNMGEWLSLDADTVAAIEASGKEVTLEYVGQNIGFRVVIPAGAKISHFADEHGAVCVVCLAEYYGYKRIGAEDVLRKPLE